MFDKQLLVTARSKVQNVVANGEALVLPAILIYTPVGVMYQSPSSFTSACPAYDKHGISSPNSASYKEGKKLIANLVIIFFIFVFP